MISLRLGLDFILQFAYSVDFNLFLGCLGFSEIIFISSMVAKLSLNLFLSDNFKMVFCWHLE